MATKRPVTFTHPEKRYFPSGFTKGDMLEYYVGMAKTMLPHLRNRPVTLIRFPEGAKGESFYEKNAPAHAPDWIETFPVPRRKHAGSINYILINNAATLAWCANLGAIEFHPFLHRVPTIAQPTHVAFDLDPGEGSNVLTCIEVAFILKNLLAKLGLQAFPKVSGSKGIQLYVPLNRAVRYETTTPFAKTVAEHLAKAHPALIVSEMPKVLRKGKVMIDWSQNVQSKTTVCVYSMRAKRDEPFISVPVEWRELEAAAKAKDADRLYFTPAETLKRVAKLGDLFAPVLTLKQKLPEGFMKLTTGGSAKGRASPPGEPASDHGSGHRSDNGAPGGLALPKKGSLARYAAKRDFTKTGEPAPAKVAAGNGKVRRYVIQKHAASHLHFDFRLEMGGTLKSWAVPKGLPYELGVRRSAFEVEDHPISYIDFEGTIPQGQYGGGTVMVWDRGTYEIVGGSFQAGDLKLRLHGKKLEGAWHIFRIRSEEKKPVWLIIKSGEAMKPLSARQEDSSVVTRRSMARIAKDNDRQWASK